MATDVSSQVTVAIKVVDQATPAIEAVTQSLKGIEQVQQQINDTAAKMATNIPHSMAEVAAQPTAAANIWNLPVRGAAAAAADLVPDIAPAAQEAVDETSTIFEKLEGVARRVWENIKRAFSGGFDWITSTAKRIASGLGAALDPIAAGVGFGLATALDGITTGIQKLVDTVGKLGPMAKDIGISIAELQRLNEWAKEGGAPIDRVDNALADLSKTLGKIAQGAPGTKAARTALEDLLGKNWEAQIAGKPVPEVLRELSTAFQALDDPQRQAADAAGLFTQKWKIMLPLLMQGPAAMDAANEAADKAGTISPKMQKAAEGYAVAMAKWHSAYDAFQEKLGAAVVPALTPALESLTKFLEDNQEGIVNGLQALVDGFMGFANAISTVTKVLNDLKDARFGDLLHDVQAPSANDTQRWKTWGDVIRDIPWDPMTAPMKLAIPLVEALGKAWEAVANAIDSATAAWGRWKGIPETPAGAAPSVPAGIPEWPVGAAPTPPTPPVVSPGGGTMPWQNLAGGAPGGPIVPAAPNGTVNVVIQNKNPPPGQQVAASANGQGVKTRVDTGVSMPWSAPATDYSGGPWAPAGA